MEANKLKTVEVYLQSIPPDKIEKTMAFRKLILEALPEATETIGYNMPAYKYKKFLVYFAVHKNHIGFYPTASPIETFKNQLSDYKHAKGSIQFPFNKEFPHDLIKAICRFRFQEVINHTK
ncbi:MAG: DUF1801 domain-containing protein [Sphingobacteriia bacterium]|nr:DUF1801 domain-containing protein [Sphingobacteriia bacterium]